MKYLIIFMVGFLAGRLDAKYGYEIFFEIGKFTREKILRMEPLDYTHKE